MNTKLLLKVKAAILAEPAKFRMELYFQSETSSPCGTAACIGGHAIAISRKWKRLRAGFKLDSYHPEASRCLEIAPDSEQADSLFSAGMWPRQFRDRYYKARTAKQRAKAAADRIDHFIATEGRE